MANQDLLLSVPAAQGSQPSPATQPPPVDSQAAEYQGEQEVMEPDQFLRDAAAMLNSRFVCIKCGEACAAEDGIQRSRFTWICHRCSRVNCTLRRNLDWPPADFSSLPEKDQQEFWKSCKELEPPSGRLSYTKVRALLVKKITARIVHSRSAEEWSDPKPLEAWKTMGWDVKMIEEKARKTWNSAAGWLYEVPVVRTSRRVTMEDIDERIQVAEQAIREKKQKREKKDEADVDKAEYGLLESCSDDELPQPKKPKLSAAKDPAKEAAAAARKEAAATGKHNRMVQGLATRVVSLIQKPVQELKKAVDFAANRVAEFPPAVLQDTQRGHEEMRHFLQQAEKVLKAVGPAAAKNTRLPDLDYNFVAVQKANTEHKKTLLRYNAVVRSLKLK